MTFNWRFSFLPKYFIDYIIILSYIYKIIGDDNYEM